MAGILSGFGRLGFYSTDLEASAIAQNILLTPDLLDFSVTTETGDSRKARAWRECKRVTVGTAAGEEDRTLTIQIAGVDWAALQFAEGELATNVDVSLPAWKSITVPLTAPFEITDADITAGTEATVKAVLAAGVGANPAGYLSRVGNAPAAIREFQADGANTKIIFDSGLAGASINYVVDKAYTSLPSIGVAQSAVKFGDFGFIGHGCGPEFPYGVDIHIPKVQKTGRPTYSTADEVPTLEIPFECVVLGNNREPVHFYLPQS